VCISLCTTVVHSTAKNSSDNISSYPLDNHHCSDAVYWRGGGQHVHIYFYITSSMMSFPCSNWASCFTLILVCSMTVWNETAVSTTTQTHLCEHCDSNECLSVTKHTKPRRLSHDTNTRHLTNINKEATEYQSNNRHPFSTTTWVSQHQKG